MKTNDFTTPLTSKKLNENMNKMFGVRVKLDNYSREQLEDMRNKLRTRVFQQEGSAGVNDLLTNETYQKDKAMLDLLNTRIKEMLGENIKKLRDKMIELSEVKKGIRDVKRTKKAKGPNKDPLEKIIATKKFKEDGTGDLEENFFSGNKTSSGGSVTKTATGVIHKAGSKGYGNKWDGKNQDQDQAPAKKSSKSAAEKKAEKANDIKLPPWKGNVTRHSSNHGADKDDGTGDLEEGRKHSKGCDCKECMGTMEGLKGKQSKLDVNKNGKLEKSDFEKLRSKKKVKESINIFKHNVRFVNESLDFLLREDEEGKAKTITAAGDMVNDFTSWMQRVGQYQTKTMIELADAIKADFGVQEAEAFKATVGPALSTTLETLTQQREVVSSAVATLAGEAVPDSPMGMEPEMPMEPGMDASAPDDLNPEPVDDEFGAADAAAGMGTTGREMRESKFVKKLKESHDIMSTLAK